MSRKEDAKGVWEGEDRVVGEEGSGWGEDWFAVIEFLSAAYRIPESGACLCINKCRIRISERIDLVPNTY